MLFSCREKEKEVDYAVRVENDYLNNGTIDSVLTTERFKNLFRDEYINKWIRNRVLYKEAVKKGILDDEEYKKAVADIKEEAAIAVYLKRLNEELDISFNEEDLKNFFKEKSEEFKCGDDAYVFNEISFVSYEKAVQFRATLLESSWENTFKVFKGDPTIRKSSEKKFSFANEIQPNEIYKIVVNMQENDISILTETEPGVFTIVQLIKNFPRESVPDYEYIAPQVKERYLMQKRKELIDEKIKNFYSKYDIEIKKDK